MKIKVGQAWHSIEAFYDEDPQDICDKFVEAKGIGKKTAKKLLTQL